MYKYYKELDDANNFESVLVNIDNLINNLINCNNNLPFDFYSKHHYLFNNLDTIYFMLESFSKYNKDKFEFSELWDFYEEEYAYYKKFKTLLSINSFELSCFFRFILTLKDLFIYVFPDSEKYILNVFLLIEKALIDIENITNIEIFSNIEEIVFKWPNAWYITPHGYLYNTGCGHKNGNFIYQFKDVVQLLELDRNININNNQNDINLILKQGYINNVHFRNYANLIYNLPFDAISYQNSLITLVSGFLDAEDSFYESFTKFNISKRKKYLIHKLYNMCLHSECDLRDLLILFCGFHKVESALEKTITSSSLYSIKSFEKYLENGWNLQIIPGIVYDKYLDDINFANMSSPFIEKYIENIDVKYPGKIIIKNNDYLRRL